MDTKYVLSELLGIMRRAVEVLRSESPLEISAKAQGDFVTSIDYSIENFLIGELGKILPEAGVISEESSPRRRDINWFIDPIDGTGNMIYGFPFAVSVALADAGNEAIMGAIYDASRDVIFYAVRGEGAFVQAYQKEPERILIGDHSRSEGLCIFGMPYDRNKAHRILSIAEKLYTISSDLKRIGPSSLDICAVAEGRAKIYAELDLKEWDYKAGGLILQEAGGKIGGFDDLLIFCESESVMRQVIDLLDLGKTDS